MTEGDEMKIVGRDNLASEAVADILWMDGIPNTPECRVLAKRICEKLNKGLGDGPGMFYDVQPDTYRLSRGMADLV
jgi:hypothetical protein